MKKAAPLRTVNTKVKINVRLKCLMKAINSSPKLYAKNNPNRAIDTLISG